MSSKESTSAFMQAITRTPQMKVLSVLVQTPKDEFTKTEMAQRARIGRTTLYRVWDELERMRAIVPSRQVGPVTLYRINPSSPVIESLTNITKTLSTVTDAIGRISELKEIQRAKERESSDQIMPGSSILIKLDSRGAYEPGKALVPDHLHLSRQERQALEGLVTAGLVSEQDGRYHLTSLGVISAKGASRIWKGETRQTMSEAISSARSALETIDKELKGLRTKLGR